MQLSKKTLEILRDIINEKCIYRSGPQIIDFFSQFDYKDVYGNDYLRVHGLSFPSRWAYTDLRLAKINGTNKISVCIQQLFTPINFIDDLSQLDTLIAEFNKYLQFDKFKVVRINTEITIQPLKQINLDEQLQPLESSSENSFIKNEFKVDCTKLNLIPSLLPVIESRMIEIENAFKAEAYLSVVFLAGSTLEGLFLNIASLNPRVFNTMSSSPKKDGKVKNFDQWTLNNFIEVSHEIGLLEKDTYRFSKELRDFRNYIHPFQQMAENFSPREQTAKICLQVLKSAIIDLNHNESKLNT